MHDTLVNRGNVNYEPYTSEQQKEIYNQALKYLDKENEIDFNSIREVYELFTQMKVLWGEAKKSGTITVKHKKRDTKKDTDEIKEDFDDVEDRDDQEESVVGEEEGTTGFGLGKANPFSKPKMDDDLLNASYSPDKSGNFDRPGTMENLNKSQNVLDLSQSMGLQGRIPDKQTAFVEWKKTDGIELCAELDNNRNEVKIIKEAIKSAGDQCKNIKFKIEELTEYLDSRKDEKLVDKTDNIDSEHFEKIKELKELRKS